MGDESRVWRNGGGEGRKGTRAVDYVDEALCAKREGAFVVVVEVLPGERDVIGS